MTIKAEPLDDVLNFYDIKVLSVKNESYKDKKGVWWIETDKGLMVLKKMSCSQDTLKYIISAVKHLQANEVNVPKIIKTKEGLDFAIINDTCFILNVAVKGKNPSYNEPKELEEIIKGLALFHKASKGYFPPPGTNPKIHLGTWVEDYIRQIEDMNSFYKNELSGSSVIGSLIVKEFPQFYERSVSVIEKLNDKNYKDWVKKAQNEGSLCHQDFAAGNLLLDSTGKLYVLDTDSLTVDISARDIRKIMNKIMKKEDKWDLEATRKIFSIYQSQNPLTVSQWQVVKLDMMFPHLFIGAMNKYYYKRDKEWTDDNYLKRIKSSILDEKSKMNLIEKFDSIIPG